MAVISLWKNRCQGKRYKGIALTGIIISAISIFSGCEFTTEGILDTYSQTGTAGQVTVEKEAVVDINDITIQDDPSIYEGDEESSIITMYLTVRQGNAADSTDHTWAELNQYSIYDYDEMDEARYGVEAILQIGDENGPLPGEVGFKSVVPNAVVRVRGATNSVTPQKSYKIELMDSSETWRGQKTIALNKHVYDKSRMRNKLSFDYIKQISNMIGLRTQFVHLYVKDETDKSSSNFEDYGLYTQIEQPNKRFLRNHGLDRNGHLYKATYFEFLRYQDVIRLKTDPLYKDTEFQKILEIKGNEDHSKLIDMLEAVNDFSLPIEDVFEYYFDVDNYFTWLAFTILTGNIDTQTQNFYIYSPTNSHTWYFIPWDYDGAFSRYENEAINNYIDNGFEEGISTYWGSILHKRVLSITRYRKLLDDKIQELRSIMTPERTTSMVESYRSSIKSLIFTMPDQMYLELSEDDWNRICNSFTEEVETNYQLYLRSLEEPMPFFLNVPDYVEDFLSFSWGTAFDLDAENITYHLEISKTYLFDDKIVDIDGLKLPSYSMEMLEPGQYFYRVTATNESGYSQEAFDYYVDIESMRHHGVMCFYVLDDGTVVQGGTTTNEQ